MGGKKQKYLVHKPPTDIHLTHLHTYTNRKIISSYSALLFHTSSPPTPSKTLN